MNRRRRPVCLNSRESHRQALRPHARVRCGSGADRVPLSPKLRSDGERVSRHYVGSSGKKLSECRPVAVAHRDAVAQRLLAARISTLGGQACYTAGGERIEQALDPLEIPATRHKQRIDQDDGLPRLGRSARRDIRASGLRNQKGRRSLLRQ